jgi:hypothetical protein
MVTIRLVGTDHLPATLAEMDEPVAVRPGVPPAWPWAWVPGDLPAYGIAPGEDEEPRVWFLGTPDGFQADAFRDTVAAYHRGDGRLTPLARDTLARVSKPVAIAVLTAPS